MNHLSEFMVQLRYAASSENRRLRRVKQANNTIVWNAGLLQLTCLMTGFLPPSMQVAGKTCSLFQTSDSLHTGETGRRQNCTDKVLSQAE